MLDQLIEAPTQEEFEYEEYMEEVDSSDLNNQGRSAMTGY
jgi:hypothetical protein